MLDNELKLAFKNPPASMRPAPLWVWNDMMTEGNIEKQLKELAGHGFGGAFVHPRPGLVTEYLSDEWFSMWEFALMTAKKLGLKLYIYDENSYPSGFAGGHVSSRLPDCLATSAICKVTHITESADVKDNVPKWIVSGKLIQAYTCIPPEGNGGIVKLLKEITEIPQEEWISYGEWVMTIELKDAHTLSWLGNFAYVDLLRPEVAKEFIETTYEAYFKRFGSDFGENIPAIFVDEPSISGSNIYGSDGNDSLPFSFWFAEQFARRRGYSILNTLPCIFKNVECDFMSKAKDSKKVRYDYYTTIRELWTENFIRPISEWCEKHNIAWTGHYMEHTWPLAAGETSSPDTMSNYEYMKWPAIDMLMTGILKDKPSDLLLFSLLELRSVAAQLNKERILCEAFGAGGWDSTFEDYKRIGDWIIVNGVNFINQHLTYSTIVGARKRDHPQSFDWREPWWNEYTNLNDYFGRLSIALSQGKSIQRILVLHPTTTGYLVPKEEESSDIIWGKPPLNPDMRSYLEMLQWMTDKQWDFDLGDEYILERHAKVKDKKMNVGIQSYDLVVVHGDMKNMRASTIRLLNNYLSCGGTVVSLGKPGTYVDGEKCESAYEELFAYPQWNFIMNLVQLETLLNHFPGAILHSENIWPCGVNHMRRELENGETLYFFVNHSMEEFDTELTLDGMWAEKWNLWSGDSEKMDVLKMGSEISFQLKLRRNESLLVFVGKDVRKTTMDEHSLSNTFTELPTHCIGIEPEEPNVLTLDYCDLFVDGELYADINTIEAGNLLYRNRGFEMNPWDNSIQYRRRLLDRNNYDESSGFSVSYHFKVAENFASEELFLAVERPEFYILEINGSSACWKEGVHWLDHNIGLADIATLVHKGENTVKLIAKKFDVLLEVEAVYLRGNFSVFHKNGEWFLGIPCKPSLGSWVEQGYPFYAGAVSYRYSLDVPETGIRVEAVLPEHEATVCMLTVNGQNVGLPCVDGDRNLNISKYLKPGVNMVELRLCGSMKNLLGPHHMKSKPRRIAWPAFWKSAPRYHQPAADEYDFIAYGLYDHMRFRSIY